ncbi:MAG: methyl-accepting chemotaxis protein [Cyanobacteria bacterium J06649_4]
MQTALDSTLTLAQKVELMNQTLRGLGGQTAQIHALSPLLSDFAYRIGMLALSSAVEEMSNKTQGEDLVWVSNEVRSLAEQIQTISEEFTRLGTDVQTSLKDVIALSDSSVTAAQSGSESAHGIMQTFEDMEDAEEKMVAANQQFLLSLEQQFDAMGQVTDALTIVEQNSQGIVSNLAQAQRDAEILEQTAQDLKKMT